MLFGLPKVPRQLSFHQDSWEEGEETNLAMEDSWQMLLDNSEVQKRKKITDAVCVCLGWGLFSPIYRCVIVFIYIV